MQCGRGFFKAPYWYGTRCTAGGRPPSSRSGRLPLDERLAVTTVALGRFLRDGAVMMAPLAEGFRLTVKGGRQFTVCDSLFEGLHYFAVRHLGRLILVRQRLDLHFFRIYPPGMSRSLLCGIPSAQPPGPDRPVAGPGSRRAPAASCGRYGRRRHR